MLGRHVPASDVRGWRSERQRDGHRLRRSTELPALRAGPGMQGALGLRERRLLDREMPGADVQRRHQERRRGRLGLRRLLPALPVGAALPGSERATMFCSKRHYCCNASVPSQESRVVADGGTAIACALRVEEGDQGEVVWSVEHGGRGHAGQKLLDQTLALGQRLGSVCGRDRPKAPHAGQVQGR